MKSAFHGLTLAVLLCALCPLVGAKQRGEAATAPLPDLATTEWVLLLPDDGPVKVTGVASFDQAGSGPGNMMYPAPNAAGLLAAIVTHGVIQSAQKRKQHARIQEAANQVLQPYQATLSAVSNRDVAIAALARMPSGDRKTLGSGGPAHAGAWRISVSPSFSLTQDQRAFVLDNTIVLLAPGATSASRQTSIRVVSQPSADEDPTGAWTADGGSKLKEELAYLFSESIDVALLSWGAPPGSGADTPFATVRYVEGGSEKIERAQPLRQTCGRLVLKTLRGTLMSVPARSSQQAGATAENCPTP